MCACSKLVELGDASFCS
jgi:hypothetical protein